MSIIKVIIPAYNEADSIAHVIKDIPDVVNEIIVVSNNSNDDTEINAENAGATVITEANKGYGYACLKGMTYISKQKNKPDIVVFLDGDYSDYPEELTKIIKPIIDDDIDFVVGARTKHLRENGSMTLPQIFGNWLATTLMTIFFRAKFSDLGPFRAIKYDKLLQLNMEDKTYGWTVEMQLKVLKQKLSYTEIPVNGAIFAGVKILGWIFKYSLKK